MVRARNPGSGGPRVGTPGVAYTNRSDLNTGARTQPVQTAPGQPYGAASAQAAAQKAIPLPTQAGGVPAGPDAGPPPQASGPVVPPGGLGALHDQTGRPNEPLTAGLPTGAGPGPEAIGQAQDPTLAFLQGVYTQHPNADVRALMLEAQSRKAMAGN